MLRYQQDGNVQATNAHWKALGDPVKGASMPGNVLREKGQRTQLGELTLPSENTVHSTLDNPHYMAKKRPYDDSTNDQTNANDSENHSPQDKSYSKRRTLDNKEFASPSSQKNSVPVSPKREKTPQQLIEDFNKRLENWPVTNLPAEDAVRANNHIAMSEYAQSAMKFLVNQQSVSALKPDSITKQTDISSKMREILIDWLIDIHAKFSLRSETLHLSIVLMDIYLSKHIIPRSKLQLTGVTALFIASKIEEIYPPEVADFSFVTDNSCSVDMILAYEVEMLSTLNFDVYVPTSFRLLDRLIILSNMYSNKQYRLVAQCLLELQLIDINLCIQWTPLQRAASAIYLTRRVLRIEPSWCNSLKNMGVEFPEMNLIHVKRCARSTVPLLENFNKGGLESAGKEGEKEGEKEGKKKVADNFQALRKKFSSKENGQVTKLFASLV